MMAWQSNNAYLKTLIREKPILHEESSNFFHDIHVFFVCAEVKVRKPTNIGRHLCRAK